MKRNFPVDRPLVLTLEEYKEHRNAKAAVIFFTASWCGPCKGLYPRFQDIANQAPKGISMIKVDVPNSPEVDEYIRVESFPTFRFYLNGKHLTEMEFSGAQEDRLIDSYNHLVELMNKSR